MLKYIMGLLVVLVLVLGYTTYTLIGDLAVSKQEVNMMTEVANANSKAAKTLEESCQSSLNAIQANQKVIDALNESRGSDLDALMTIPQITLPETHINASTKPTAAPTKSADDVRLSPDLMRLLDNAYCSGAKTDPYCTAR